VNDETVKKLLDNPQCLLCVLFRFVKVQVPKAACVGFVAKESHRKHVVSSSCWSWHWYAGSVGFFEYRELVRGDLAHAIDRVPDRGLLPVGSFVQPVYFQCQWNILPQADIHVSLFASC